MVQPIFIPITTEEVPSLGNCKYQVKIKTGIYTCAQNEQEYKTALEQKSINDTQHTKETVFGVGIILLVFFIIILIVGKYA